MADNDLVTALKLAGLDDILAQLRRLGDQGEESFKKLEQSAKAVTLTAVTGAVKDLGSAFNDVGSSVKNLVNTIGGLVGINIGSSITSTLNSIVKSGTDAAGAVQSFSKATGIAFDEAANFATAFGAFGISADQLSSAIRRLSIRVQSEWPQVVKAIRDAGDAAIKTRLDVEKSAIGVAQANIGLKSSYVSLATAARDLARFEEDLSSKRVQANNSVKSSEISLIEARAKLREIDTGVGLDEEQKRRLERQKAVLAVSQAEEALATARKARERAEADEAIERENKLTVLQKARLEVQTALIQAQLAPIALRDAQKKELEDLSNSVPRLVEFVNVLRKGGDTSGFTNLNKSADNLFKGILGSLPGATKALQNFEGGIADITAETPETKEALFAIGDVFKNIENASTRTALKMMLFGRNVPEAFIKFLSQGRSAVEEQVKTNEKLGLSFTEVDAAAAKGFKIATNSLDTTLQLMKDKIGVLFAPLTTDITNALNEKFKEAFPKIKAFFETVVEQIKPFFVALGNVIRGTKFEDFVQTAKLPADTLASIQEWQATLESFKEKLTSVGKSILDFFLTTLPAAIAVVSKTLDSLAESFTALFGIKITGDQLGLLLLLGRVTGINDAVIDLTKSVVLLVVAFGALLFINPFAAAILGIAALTIGIVAFPDLVKAAFDLLPGFLAEPLKLMVTLVRSFLLVIKGDFNSAFDEIKKWWDEPLKPKNDKGLLDDIKKGMEDFFSTIDKKVEESVKKSASSYSGLQQNASSALTKIATDGEKAANKIQSSFTKTTDAIKTQFDSAHNLTGLSDAEVQRLLGTGPNQPTPANPTPKFSPTNPSLPIDTVHNLSGLSDEVLRQLIEGQRNTKEAIDRNTDVTQVGVQATEEGAQADTGFETGIETVNTTLEGARTSLAALLIEMNSTLKEILTSINIVVDRDPSSPNKDSKFAGGGRIFGPGSATSDTVPIWASPGEWMHPVKAVQHYGASFMRAIQTLQFPRGFAMGGLITAMPMPQRFALGGLISPPTPAFAANASSLGRLSPSQKRGLTIQLGGSTFSGFSGPVDVVDKLERQARTEELTSTGRKPNRVR